MRLKFLIVIALRELVRSKLRSSLTMLGVIIGVGSVITMVSIGEGATASDKSAVSRMGRNVLQIRSGSASSSGISWGAGSGRSLVVSDVDAIVKECHSVVAVSPVIRYRTQIMFESQNWIPNSIEGVSEQYADIMDWPADEGRWFNDGEVKGRSKVCLIGSTIFRELFKNQHAIGSTIRVGNVPLEVIGVLQTKGTNAWGSDQDDTVVLPWTTMRIFLQSSGSNDIDRISVSVASAELMSIAREELTGLLRDRHRLQPGDPDDFNIRDFTSIADVFSETSRVMTTLLAVIALVSLIVGGIGIMNIMLVSVSERTREIGVRMSVGGSSRDILFQFLVESMVLSCIGGIIGIAAGVAASNIISAIARWPTLISVESILIAIGFSLGTGMIFGYYPAWRASKLNPIECLRN